MGINIEMVGSGAPGFQVVRPSLEGIRASGLVVEGSRWCCWRAEWGTGTRPKPAKVPYGSGGRRLKVSEASDWLTFDEVCQLHSSGGFEGVGVLMSSVSLVVGLDLDGCLDHEGNVTADMSQVVADFLAIGGYVEVSPSGSGLRQFVRGIRNDDYREKTGPLEIYDQDSARYLTMTGCPYPVGGEAGSVLGERLQNDIRLRLEAFTSQYMERVPDAPPLEFDASEFSGSSRTAAQVLSLLKTHNKRGKVTRLLAGNLDDHNADHSAADLALACEVAYFCRNPIVIDEIVRGSGLMRPKWDEARGRETYGQRTIRKALAVQTRSYDADQAAKASGQAQTAAVMIKAGAHISGGVVDLQGAKGRLRSDPWALTELLLRDRRLLGVCYYDEFAGMPMITRSLAETMADKCAPVEAGRLTDDHINAFARWFGREWSLSLRTDQVRAAVMGLAQAVRLNPVQRRLDELGDEWDGEMRLDSWLVKYLKAVQVVNGVNILPYLQAVGARWILSIVARGYQPGCKVDDMLILEGAQGARKSSAVRALAEAITPDCFREGFSLGMGKDDQIALRGRLIVEWAELSGLSRHDRNALKNFLTLGTDSYRQVYGMFERAWPRTAVFVGTTNDSSYLSDPTGNRRFLPVAVGRIDIDALRLDAAQIIGEAVVRYKAGAKWWLDDTDAADAHVLALARREQAGRVGSTFWSEIANDLAERLVRGELFQTTGGAVVEAFPAEAFSVPQMRVWLATSSAVSPTHDGAGNRGQSESEIVVSDANWSRITDGLRLAGWESRKTSGRMAWELSVEKRDELCSLFGRGMGPTISEIRRARRDAAKAVSQTLSLPAISGEG